MRTLESFKNELYDKIYQEDVLGFKKVFDELDNTVLSLREQKIDKSDMFHWYKLYSDLFNFVVPNNLVDFYEIVLDTKISLMKNPLVLTPEQRKVIVMKNFTYLFDYFHEEIVIAYIKHLRTIEKLYPQLKTSISVIPVLALRSYNINEQFLKRVLFECQYDKTTLQYLLDVHWQTAFN